MPGWLEHLLLFCGASIAALTVAVLLYVPVLNIALRRYSIWQLQEPVRRRGRTRIRFLHREYRETGEMHPELQAVYDEIDEFA